MNDADKKLAQYRSGYFVLSGRVIFCLTDAIASYMHMYVYCESSQTYKSIFVQFAYLCMYERLC